ncbi:MAG: cupin domain-containing protein [Bosea sp. (in: a-proteobacteria)]|uniref:cupin domain-containing protein n=1 Tax=Bosea sp. (in: a-proteobacteria) TaxID=1871050 RepID=UPI002735D282|nr:cupin domain-containing protein [Bosea sp. (in: a-proteobacteria)]MDP3257250.1 cupin domain-containing protein [Bosea sp. (in: a-proteobacteria)]MDP3317626.1 cupin domain-containing protein [Bosea sp. (in: a-proteobacteria)]
MTDRLNSFFQLASDIAWEPTEPGVKRKIMAYGPDLMVVRVVFEAGAVGKAHQHPHRQACYVESGVFDVTIDGQTQRLSAGDTFFVPADLVHGVTAVEAGQLIDSFTPMRSEFL